MAPSLAHAMVAGGMWALKGTLVLVLALLLLRIAARAPAAQRHAMLIVGLGTALLLPMLGALVPAWNVPAPWISVDRAMDDFQASPAASGMSRSGPPLPGGAAEHDRIAGVEETSPLSVDVPARADYSHATRYTTRSDEPVADVTHAGGRDWIPIIALLVWTVGCVTLVGRWTMGIAIAARIVKTAKPVAGARARRAIREARLRARWSGPIRLLESVAIDVPVAWGLGPPVIVLPLGAMRWPRERLAAVLDHEMAHLTRRDAWTQLLAQAAVAVHWFNPLAWIAYGRALREREHAADDVVLALGATAVGYAETLMGIASAGRRAPAGAPAFLLPGHAVEHRIRRMLDRSLDRRPLTLPARAFVGATGLCVALPLAAMQPVPAPDAESNPEAALFWSDVDRERTRTDGRIAATRTALATSVPGPVPEQAPPGATPDESEPAASESRADAAPPRSGIADESASIVQASIDEARRLADLRTISAWAGLEPRPLP